MQHGKVLCRNEFGAPSAFAEHSSYQTEVLTDESEQETLTQGDDGMVETGKGVQTQESTVI